jgi:hypothetical protein
MKGGSRWWEIAWSRKPNLAEEISLWFNQNERMPIRLH